MKEHGTELRDVDVVKEREVIKSKYNSITPTSLNGFALAVNSLTKYFPKGGGYKHVFDDITFGVRCNDVFGLLGPNGAGKTTLINILSGNLSANSGEFKIFGHTSSERDAIRHLIGVVPQFDVFFDNLTVKEHLLLVARLHGVKKEEELMKVKSAAQLVGLERDAFNMKAMVLSGGQKRRLSLAMSMVSQPQIVFLDEPTVSARRRREE